MAPHARDSKMVIADTLTGIRREQRARPTGKKAVIAAADLARLIARAEGEGPRAIRDRMVLVLGLAAALWWSELVALQLADLALVELGLTLRIRQSKTDQDREAAVMAIPAGKVLTPVKYLNAWLQLRGGETGPLFTRIGTTGLRTTESMSDRSVARLVQRYGDQIGLDPCSVAGHSLRAGFLTELPGRGLRCRRCRRFRGRSRSMYSFAISGRQPYSIITRARGFYSGGTPRGSCSELTEIGDVVEYLFGFAIVLPAGPSFSWK